MDDLVRRVAQPVDEADFDRVGRQYLVDRLLVVASRHEAAEEMTFWPHVRRRLTGGESLAERGLLAERDFKGYLDVLRVTRSEDEIIAEASRLQTMLRDHVRFEEAEVFPAMHRCTTRVWRALAGFRFLLARRAAPTRPHPAGPDTLAGFATVGAPAIVLDHLRDRRSAQRRQPDGFEDPDHLDAIAVVMKDHRRIRDLLDLLDAQDDPDDTLVHDTIRQLAIHDSIERQYLYPAVRRRLRDGNGVYSRLITEHGQMAAQAATLEAYRFHDRSRTAWLRELAAASRIHMDHEETAVLPILRARLTSEELIHLGRQIASARETAPTRPHPHIAGAGAGARLSRRVAGPMDKARDAITRRS